jgi:hypothetical protein
LNIHHPTKTHEHAVVKNMRRCEKTLEHSSSDQNPRTSLRTREKALAAPLANQRQKKDFLFNTIAQPVVFISESSTSMETQCRAADTAASPATSHSTAVQLSSLTEL